ANLYAEAGQLKHDPGNTFSVPYTWGTTGLCYRSDLVKAEPTSWNDLLSPSADLKGKITMLATDRWLMAAAFLADGLSVNTDDHPCQHRDHSGRASQIRATPRSGRRHEGLLENRLGNHGGKVKVRNCRREQPSHFMAAHGAGPSLALGADDRAVPIDFRADLL